ncbi:MAG: hypothetical protein MK207_08620 [Saprospiraceae bacterium]|nr:hypothetical protein [Saprospiraceae bacterium]
MKFTLLLFIFFFALQAQSQETNKENLVNNNPEDSTEVEPMVLTKEQQRYQNDEKRLLIYLKEKKYKSLMRLSNEMVHKYFDKGLPQYTYAIGLYALMDKDQFKKTYDKYRMQYWKMICLMLRNSKKNEYDTELVKCSWILLDGIQNGIFEVAQIHMKIGNDKNALKYLTMIMEVFDQRKGIYKNKYQNLIQDKIFARAKNHYESGKMNEADFVFNWLDKFFYKSQFNYKYAGLACWKDPYYQFEEWSHSKYYLANTANKLKGLSDTEKNIIFLQNLVRMNPTLFRNTFLKKYLERYPEFTGNSYVSSLRSELDGKSPVPLLYVDNKLIDAAIVYQQNSIANKELILPNSDATIAFSQHVRGKGSQEIISENGFYGNSEKPEDIVMGLLINQGIPDLLHRKTILNASFIQIGLAILEHPDYDINIAIDYSTGDEETRKRVAKERAARAKEASDKLAREKEAIARAAREKRIKEKEAKDMAAKEKAFKSRKNKAIYMGSR